MRNSNLEDQSDCASGDSFGYDPELGRFLSADPFVPEPGNSQAFNRYSCTVNDPLSHTDPSGYVLQSVAQAAIITIASMANPGLGMAVGAAFGYMNTGTRSGALYGGIAAGVSAGVGAAAQKGAWSAAQTAAMHGATQGTMGAIMTGSVTHGLRVGVAAFAGSRMGSQVQEWDLNTAQELTLVMMSGGAASRVTGGSFRTGAMTAAVVYAMGRAAGHDTAESEWSSEDTAAAGASQLAYEEEGGLLTLYGITYDSTDGLGAVLTIGVDGNYILAFRGTAADGDWRANIGQALFGESAQYDQAVDLAIEVHQATGGSVTFAGHSLGGGLASTAAYATGGRGTTFNAAGLHSSYRTGAHSGIRAHYIRGDVLTTVQQLTPLPNAVGKEVPHSGSGGPFRRHALSNFP